MTKARAPLTFERAITRIADLLGWDAMAEVVGKKARTVMDWSDPDTSAGISLRDAFHLDLAYQRAGGDTAPIADCYQLRLEAEQGLTSVEADELNARVAKSVKEGGEAYSALIVALRPGATPLDREVARRELEESIEADTRTLALLKPGAGPGASTGGVPRGGASR